MCSSLLNLKLILAYDGTNYLGWQKTALGLSIENSLQNALKQIFQHEIVLQAASRTDAGVHAQGQCVNFFTHKDIDPNKLLLSVNALLPKDIRVLQVAVAHEGFHPTLDSIGKTYHYHICQGTTQLPQNRLYSWHIAKPLNLLAMKKAAIQIIGEHDFSAFCNVKNNEVYQDKTRHLQNIEFLEICPNRLQIRLKGRNFLYKMARNIVGTLVYIGIGKMTSDNIISILQDKDRTKAGVSAPAHGLTLYEVHYPVE